MKCGLSLNTLLSSIENESAFHDSFFPVHQHQSRRNGLSMADLHSRISPQNSTLSLVHDYLTHFHQLMSSITMRPLLSLDGGGPGPNPPIKERCLFVNLLQAQTRVIVLVKKYTQIYTVYGVGLCRGVKTKANP